MTGWRLPVGMTTWSCFNWNPTWTGLDIEELHQLMQHKQSVKGQGVVLQKLAQKDFQKADQRSSTACRRDVFTKPSYQSGNANLEPQKLTKALNICTHGQGAIERHDQQIGVGRQAGSRRSRSVQQMSPLRRQTPQVCQKQERIGMVSHAEMTRTRVERLFLLRRRGTHSA